MSEEEVRRYEWTPNGMKQTTRDPWLASTFVAAKDFADLSEHFAMVAMEKDGLQSSVSRRREGRGRCSRVLVQVVGHGSVELRLNGMGTQQEKAFLVALQSLVLLSARQEHLTWLTQELRKLMSAAAHEHGRARV